MSDYQPGLYVKGGDVQRATTPSRAVALVFDGYKKVDEQEDTSYADLQAQAKALGIPANQKADALRAAIEAADDVEPEEPQAPLPVTPAPVNTDQNSETQS